MLGLEYNTPIITSANWRDLTTICLEHCSHFSLTDHSDRYCKDDLKRQLMPYLYKKINTTQWFCYRVTETNPLLISIYPVNHFTASVLLRYCDDLWSSGDTTSKFHQSCEDLCFFSNDQLVLGTVTHEDICCIDPPNDDLKKAFYEIYPYWRETMLLFGSINLNDYIS